MDGGGTDDSDGGRTDDYDGGEQMTRMGGRADLDRGVQMSGKEGAQAIRWWKWGA